MERSPRWAALVIRVVFASFAAMLTIGILLLVRHDALVIANDPGFQGLSQDIRQNVHVSAQVVSILLALGTALVVALVVIPARFAHQHGYDWPERWLPEGCYAVAAILHRGDPVKGNGYTTIAIQHVEHGESGRVSFWYQVYELPTIAINGEVYGDTLRVKVGKGGFRSYQFLDSNS